MKHFSVINKHTGEPIHTGSCSDTLEPHASGDWVVVRDRLAQIEGKDNLGMALDIDERNGKALLTGLQPGDRVRRCGDLSRELTHDTDLTNKGAVLIERPNCIPHYVKIMR